MSQDQSPSLTAAQIAEATGGRLVGDGNVAVRAVAPLDRAGAEDLSFLASAKYAGLMASTHAGVVLVSPDLAETPGSARARIVVAKPYDALIALIPRLHHPVERPAGVHPGAVVGRDVTLGEGVCIEAGVVLEDGVRVGDRTWIAAHSVIGAGTSIGADCAIYPHVFTYPRTQIGDRCTVHSGVRIGSDGYGYVQRVTDGQLEHARLPHVGRVIIGDDVDIGANSAIDRGMMDDTVIGSGTKLDNLVHIGHNVRIGRACLIMAQVGIAGSVRVEDGVMVAGQAGLAGHVTIGRGARIAAQGGVISDVPAGETWSGYPARPHKEALRASAALFKLAGLLKRLERLLEKGDA